jgi:hypothetical protein
MTEKESSSIFYFVPIAAAILVGTLIHRLSKTHSTTTKQDQDINDDVIKKNEQKDDNSQKRIFKKTK